MLENLNQPAKSQHASMSLVSILKGIVVSYIVTVPVFVIFALILANTEFPERLITPVVVITTIISVLAAGSSATRNTKSKGWLNGGIVGLIYILILYLFSGIVLKNFAIDKFTVTLAVIGALTGAIGGIIGINFRNSPRRR